MPRKKKMMAPGTKPRTEKAHGATPGPRTSVVMRKKAEDRARGEGERVRSRLAAAAAAVVATETLASIAMAIVAAVTAVVLTAVTHLQSMTLFC